MNDRSTLEEELLVEALALPAETRHAFVESRCGTDRDSANRLFALLRGFQENSVFLETSAPAAALQSAGRTFAAIPPEPEPGDRIARYHLLKRIGEGGFGVVYLAEQEEPVRRLVALKVIRLGLDTREFIARFEAERQALAVMDHPNIARVFDAGATPTGRPYLVMELIRGIPITAYCDEHKLSVGARLGLFLQVCGAIQHAHQKGIIHCDLKPSNILIELHDPPEGGCPKVIDFGIAKATPDRRTNKTLFTRFHALIGTPAYTSPEQMELSGLDVDTRSDIYSLGVLLYELLTGCQPFDPQILDHASLEEMRRTIREVDPPRPSLRISALEHVERTRVAQRRGLETEKLPALLRSDLDWIVMRCLEKDRTRRYETANGLAMDLRRHLACEPVVARPPSRSYKIEKFVRRNRTGVIAGSAVAAALIVGLVLASVGFARAKVQQRAAETARHSAESARREAEDLVSFMVKDLQPELQRVGRLPLTTQVAERAVRYYSKLPHNLNDSTTERNRAVALEGVAYVRSAAGDKEAAASAWHEALEARQRAAAGVPADPLLAVELALNEFVEVSHSFPLVATQAWGYGSPENDTRLAAIVDRARTACHDHLGDHEVSLVFARLLVCETNYINSRMVRSDEAMALGREAESLFRALLIQRPEDVDLNAEFVRLMLTLSIAAQQHGDFDAGIKIGEEALELADRALEKYPGNIGLRENAANAAHQLSFRYPASLVKATAAELKARERWRVLMEMDPQNFAYRHQFAAAHDKEAVLLFGSGRRMEANAVTERHVRLLSAAAQTPDDFVNLQLSEARLGLCAAQYGHPDEARAHLGRMEEWHRKYLTILAPDAARQPSVTLDYLWNQCMVWEMLEDWPELERRARAMVDAAAATLKTAPGLPDLQVALCAAEGFLAHALVGQGSANKAIPILRSAARHIGEIDRQKAPIPQMIDTMDLMAKIPLAEALYRSGDLPQARTQLEQNYKEGEAHVAANSPAIWWDLRVELASNEILLATVLDRSPPAEAARRDDLLKHAAAVLENHAAENPLCRREKELLAKIKTLRDAAHPAPPATASTGISPP